MSEDSKKLEILIQIISEQLGREKADEILRRTREEAKLTSEQTLDLTDATKKYIAQLQEQGQESVSVREKMHALHAVLHSLGPEFGQLAHLARLFFNPFTAGAATAALGIEALREHLKYLHERAEALKEVRLADMFGSQDRIDFAVRSFDQLAFHLERIAAAHQSAKDIADTTLGDLKAQFEAEQQIAKLKEKGMEAQLHLLAMQQGWSPEKLANALATIHGASEDNSSAARIDEMKKELAAREGQLSQTTTDAGLNSHDVAITKNRMERAQWALNRNDQDIKDIDAKIAAREKLEEATRGKFGGGVREHLAIVNEIADLKEQKEKLEGQRPALAAATKAAEEQYNAAAGEAENLAKALKDLPEEIAKLKTAIDRATKTEGEAKAIRHNTADIERRTRAFGSPESDKDTLESAMDAMGAQAHGDRITPDQQSHIQLLKQLFDQHGQSGEKLIKLIEEQLKMHASQNGRIQALEMATKALQSQIGNARNRTSG